MRKYLFFHFSHMLIVTYLDWKFVPVAHALQFRITLLWHIKYLSNTKNRPAFCVYRFFGVLRQVLADILMYCHQKYRCINKISN